MSATTSKVHTQGTHRVRAPEETWEIIAPLLQDYGITRVSDITGLDVLGIPVAMAARPCSWTLSVSQGKGQTLLLAKVSATMEAIEFWHAERARPTLSHVAASARELGVGYSIRDLEMASNPFLGDDSRLDWVEAVGAVTGRRVPVPVDAVCFRDPSTQRWSPWEGVTSSNGLASGNCLEEAALHGLYEIIERDALSRPTIAELAAAPVLDPMSLPEETCARMVDQIISSGGQVSIAAMPSRFGVPTFKCLVWSWDFPVVCGGSGSHGDPVVALSRAVTEAAQGRAAAIAGSRDDLDLWSAYEHAHQRAQIRGQFPRPNTDFNDAVTPTMVAEDVSVELMAVAQNVWTITGQEPLLVDLSTDPRLAVVRVVAPGCAMRSERVHSRTRVAG